MDIKQIRFFVEIYYSKSFSKAAANLYISQQGLSLAIHRLENELSCKLFKRTPVGVSLTEQGEFLLPHAMRILEEFKECADYFGERKENIEKVHICCSYGVIGNFASDLIFKFQRNNPSIELCVSESPDIQCEKIVENDEAELGFAVSPIDKKKFEGHFLYSVNACIIVHRSNPLAKKTTIDLMDLHNQPIICMNENFKIYHNLKKRCEAIGFEPEFIFKASEAAVIHKFVNMGKGIGFTLNCLSHDMVMPDVLSFPINDSSVSWNVYLIKKRGCFLSEAAKTFEKYVLGQSVSPDEVL